MSFLDRLESWGVRSDKLMLTGYPELQGSRRRSRTAVD
jgi:aspartyl protease family protein